MKGKRDVWLEGGVVWAAAAGALPYSAHQDLTQRAVAMAARTATWRLIFDYRLATLTQDVLPLSRHAELLVELGLPDSSRTVMLCRQRSTSFVFWERALRARGHQASLFTDEAEALSWIHRPTTNDTVSHTAGTVTPHALTDPDLH